jgi:catechol 2,3-dioxygenase-like lactoylglutathione lyase family enzyme
MLGIRHVALRVRDIGRSVDFYTNIMKMRVEWNPDPQNVYLTGGTDNLALHQMGKDEADLMAAKGSLDHFGFIVSKPEEVDEWATLLESRGVELAQKPKTHRDGARSIYFRDPDGNLIQLLYHPPIS